MSAAAQPDRPATRTIGGGDKTIQDIDGRAHAPRLSSTAQGDIRRVAIILAIYAALALAAALTGGADQPKAALEDWRGNVAASSSLE